MKKIRFRLATLFLFITVASLLVGHYTNRVRQQRIAVAKLQELGFLVAYDPWTPDWVDAIVGVDFFNHPIWAERSCHSWEGVDCPPLDDDDLVPLRHLRGLRRLDLSDSQITDAGLEHIIRLKSLDVIYLQNTRVTERGIRELERALPNTEIQWKTRKLFE